MSCCVLSWTDGQGALRERAELIVDLSPRPSTSLDAYNSQKWITDTDPELFTSLAKGASPPTPDLAQ